MEAPQTEMSDTSPPPESAPPPERVIVTGWLDSITASKRSFQLKLSSGRTLRGILPPREPSEYAPLFAKRVVVDGVAHFRPSGAVATIVAGHIQLATPKDDVWDQMPRPQPRSLDEVLAPEEVSPYRNPVDAVWGKWPGDETIEELMEALEKVE